MGLSVIFDARRGSSKAQWASASEASGTAVRTWRDRTQKVGRLVAFASKEGSPPAQQKKLKIGRKHFATQFAQSLSASLVLFAQQETRRQFAERSPHIVSAKCFDLGG